MRVKEQLEVLTHQIIRARLYYDVWWFYAGDTTRPQIVDTLNDFSEFFRFDIHAHFVAMIVHCCTIVDGKRGTTCLQNLTRRPLLDPTRLAADAEIVERAEKAVAAAEGLKKIRNEGIAHRSNVFDYSSAFKRAKLKPDNIPVLLREFLDLANELRKKQNLPIADFTPLPLTDAMRLIHALGGPDLRPTAILDEIFRT